MKKIFTSESVKELTSLGVKASRTTQEANKLKFYQENREYRYQAVSLLYGLSNYSPKLRAKAVQSLINNGLTPTRYLSDNELESTYNRLVNKYKSTIPQAYITTTYEKEVHDLVKAHTRAMIKRSVTIGPFVTDLLLFVDEQVSSKNSPRGVIAIEVNGKIHDADEGKMKKDLSKLEAFASLGIGVFTVNNRDIGGKQFKHFLLKLETIKLEKREIKVYQSTYTQLKLKILRKIWLYTICYHASDLELKELLGLTGPQLHDITCSIISKKFESIKETSESYLPTIVH